MKIYLAATAPGTEGTKDREVCETIEKRLLSYWHVFHGNFGTMIVFNNYIKQKEESNGKKK